MSSQKEIQCIKKANEVRVASAQRRLKRLCDNGVPFDYPLAGIGWGVDWKEDPKERTKQILLLPIGFVLIIFLLLITPLAYLEHIREVCKEKQSMKNQILELSQAVNNFKTPTIKTLDYLWHLHGIDNYDTDEQVALLTDWVEILYGNEVVESLHINERLESITDSHVRANALSYEPNSDAPHFFFTPPVKCLIRKLSEELCRYDQVGF